MKRLLVLITFLPSLALAQFPKTIEATRDTSESASIAGRIAISTPGATGWDGTLVGKDNLGNSYLISTLRFETVAKMRRMMHLRAGVRYFLDEVGKEGEFRYDPTDNTSVDDIGSVVVTANGKRLKRVFNGGPINITWFDAKPGSSNNATLAIHRANQFAKKVVSMQTSCVLVPATRDGFFVDSVRVPSRVTFTGVDWNSRIMARPNIAWPLVATENSLVQNATIQSLNIHGQKANQTSSLAVGIYINSAAGGFDFSDPHITIKDVLIQDTKGDGVYMASREARFYNVVTRRTDGHGFNIVGTDNFISECTAAEAKGGSHGWRVGGSNNHFVACKAFYNGSLGDASDGWDITNGRNIYTACDAQDNGRNGFTFRSSAQDNIAQLHSDSNGGSGFVFDNSSGNLKSNNIQLTSISRQGGRYVQTKGVEFIGNGGRNVYTGTARGNTVDVSGSSTGNTIGILATDGTSINQKIGNLNIEGVYSAQSGSYNVPSNQIAYSFLHRDNSNNSTLSSADIRLGFSDTRFAGIRATRGADFASTVNLDFLVTTGNTAYVALSLLSSGRLLVGKDAINDGVSMLSVGGPVRVNGKITNVSDPVSNQDAATKIYVDGKRSSDVTYAGGTIAGGGRSTQTVTVTGAALGNFTNASFVTDVSDVVITATKIVAANQVKVYYFNPTTDPLTPSGNIRVVARQ